MTEWLELVQSWRVSDPQKPTRKIPGQEDVKRWLFDFQKAINRNDNLTAVKLFHSNAIGFESGNRSANSSEVIAREQWKELCPNLQHNFSFLMADAGVIPAPGMFVVAIKHMTIRKIKGCEPRSGQMTFVLCDFDGKLLCVHSHVSSCLG